MRAAPRGQGAITSENVRHKEVIDVRKIVCYETGKVYESQVEAARAHGISPSAISIARKTGRRAGGFHWVDDGATVAALPKRNRSRGKRCAVPVRCLETGETFGSIRQAAKSKGIRPATLSAALGGTAGGYHWKRIEIG